MASLIVSAAALHAARPGWLKVCHPWPGLLPPGRIAALVVVLLCITGGPVQAEIYKWTDAAGAIHFSDQPPPDAAATQVQVPQTNEWAAPKPQPRPIPPPAAPRSAAKQVVMYSAQWCGFCKRARHYFNTHDVPFTEYDVEHDAAANGEFKRLGGTGVPLILVGGARLQGFSEDGFERLYEQ